MTIEKKAEDRGFTEFPEFNQADAGYAVVRGLISMVPTAGGFANELLNLAVSSSIERRREVWFRSLAAYVVDLAKEVRGMSWENLARNEEFISAVIQASRIAVATHLEAKHESLRNALGRVAAGVTPFDEIQQLFLRYIEELGPGHVTS
jgi:hypothetical protein